MYGWIRKRLGAQSRTEQGYVISGVMEMTETGLCRVSTGFDLAMSVIPDCVAGRVGVGLYQYDYLAEQEKFTGRGFRYTHRESRSTYVYFGLTRQDKVQEYGEYFAFLVDNPLPHYSHPYVLSEKSKHSVMYFRCSPVDGELDGRTVAEYLKTWDPYDSLKYVDFHNTFIDEIWSTILDMIDVRNREKPQTP